MTRLTRIAIYALILSIFGHGQENDEYDMKTLSSQCNIIFLKFIEYCIYRADMIKMVMVDRILRAQAVKGRAVIFNGRHKDLRTHCTIVLNKKKL